MWEKLKSKVTHLPAYQNLTEELGRASCEVSVTGLYGSARSLVLANLVTGLNEPLLVVAPDPVKARDIEEELNVFGIENVVAYPEDEILPYDYHDPDRNITGLQMKALEAISEGQTTAVVCTLRSLLKKVFPPSVFRELLIDLKTGEEHDPFNLVSELVRLGYERHEIVEAKGQFALRGGILDVFEVSEERPVRMEFDGDEIFSMRNFDIETQRSIDERSGLRVHPLHHLAITGEGITRLRNRIENAVSGMDRETRERMILPVERFEKGISFFGMENYAAAVHDVITLFEYFERDPLVVFVDTEDLETLLKEFREEIDRRFERTLDEGHLYPSPDEVYISEGGLEERLGRLKRLYLRNLGWEGAIRMGSSAPGDYRRNLKGLLGDVRKELGRGVQVYLFCTGPFQRERAEEILSDVALDMDFPLGGLSSGFKWPELGVLFLSEEEVFGRYHRTYRIPRSRSRSLAYDHSHFQPGDFVVHVKHGIGRYMGLRVLDIEGGQTECLDIRYQGNDHLFIPVDQLRMVEKYVAAEGAEPALDKLGSTAWTRAREKARRSAERIARDLLEVYAARQIAKGFAFDPDKQWQREMEASFPYEETPHQLQATHEVKDDMEHERIMDRLLCGDVGFGKTEVAIRAAFKTVLSGKQSAVLVPTTVLAMQHYHTIMERLKGFPINVAMLSRFISTKQQKRVVEDLTEGKVDIVVGTHRLISKDVHFKDLGLVIIDEEHRFGVRHKETFKKMKKSIDVLSMTATPIPRTLSMAISGLRDISVIDTPPRNRLPIHTEILPFDDDRIRDAIIREVDRGGQVFFVHNRVQSIGVMESYLRRLLPDRVKIAHAHGQMRERELENRMIDFLDGGFHVLVCTMIIEAGLDFPNVNTIIINRADKFGLAQLYQLRGRVGRSDRKAFAYLLVPGGKMLTSGAIKRLQSISEFDYLGAGYRIAMRDLEIRGAGNLLGPQQSGHINAVGLDLYTRMLREEVSNLKGEPVQEEPEVKISVPIPAFLPDWYVHDSEERMNIYRRLSMVEEVRELEEMTEELRDRFGPLPDPAGNMLRLLDLKVRARAVGVERVEVDGKGVLRVSFAKDSVPNKRRAVDIAKAFEGRLTVQSWKGFSMTIHAEKVDEEAGGGGSSTERLRPARKSLGRGGALMDLENLLKLWELYDK